MRLSRAYGVFVIGLILAHTIWMIIQESKVMREQYGEVDIMLFLKMLVPSLIWVCIGLLTALIVAQFVKPASIANIRYLYWFLILLYPIQIATIASVNVMEIIGKNPWPLANICKCMLTQIPSEILSQCSRDSSTICECYFPWAESYIHRCVYDPRLKLGNLSDAIPVLTRLRDDLSLHPLHVVMVNSNYNFTDVYGVFEKYDFEESYPETRFMIGVTIPSITIVAVFVIPFYAYVASKENKQKKRENLQQALQTTFIAFFELFDSMMMLIMIIEKLPYFSSDVLMTETIVVFVSVTISFVFLMSMTTEIKITALKTVFVTFNNIPFLVIRAVIYTEYDKFVYNTTIGWTLFFMVKEITAVVIAVWECCLTLDIDEDDSHPNIGTDNVAYYDRHHVTRSEVFTISE